MNRVTNGLPTVLHMMTLPICGFTRVLQNYSENLYIEYYYGKEAGSDYVLGTRKRIRNDKPITGFYNVNNEGSGDMYYKGGNMLHSLRRLVNDDEKWRSILRDMNKEFYHKVVKGSQIEDYLIAKTGLDLHTMFNQYLRDVRIPVFEYAVNGNELTYRWNSCVEGFNMPLDINVSGKTMRINPTTFFKTVKLDGDKPQVKVDPAYYVGTLNISGK